MMGEVDSPWAKGISCPVSGLTAYSPPVGVIGRDGSDDGLRRD